MVSVVSVLSVALSFQQLRSPYPFQVLSVNSRGNGERTESSTETRSWFFLENGDHGEHGEHFACASVQGVEGRTMLAPSELRYVWLKGGLVLPLEPILLALELEAKGFQLSRDGDNIWVRPSSKLTDDDKAQLKLWKRHVLALLDYQAPALEVQ
jgi:hypothetical protein